MTAESNRRGARPARALAFGAVALLASAVVASAATTAPPARAEPPPPDHRLYMVSDSVGLGAKAAVPRAFPGWQVTVDGTPAYFLSMLESRHIRVRMATAPGVFGDYAVVAGGYNYPYWDPARFDREIDSLIDSLRQAGVKHVIWVTLRDVKPQYISASAWRQVQPYFWYFPTVNQHLVRALDRHPDLSLADWASIADRPGLTYDAIHLNTFGAAEYAAMVAATVNTLATRVPAGSVTRVRVAGTRGVPSDAEAVSLNLTAVNPRTRGFITAFPCGQSRPAVSSLNHDPAQTVAGAAIVKVGNRGEVCLFNSADTNLVVDLQGWFEPGGGFDAIAPTRFADSREGLGHKVAPGKPLAVTVAGASGIPSDPAAVVASVTVTQPEGDGWVTAYPCGHPQPWTSTVNFSTGQDVANLAVLEPGHDGAVCVAATAPTHVIVDLFGSFQSSARVNAVNPLRVLDSRQDQGPLEPLGERSVQIAGQHGLPDDADVAFVNLTATNGGAVGFLTAYPCGRTRPWTSNLNIVPNRAVANFVLAGVGADGRVCVFSSAGTDVVIDVSGTLVSGYRPVAPVRIFDSRERD